MLISPISNSLHAKSAINFNGLWGKTIYDSRTESEYYINDTIYEYYPFSDEKKDEIEKVVKENKSYKESTPGKGIVASPWVHSDSTSVKVMAALPFTSKDFLNYTMNRLHITKQHKIENYLITKALTVLKKH